MYWLTQSIYSFKVIPFLGGWLADRLLGDPEGPTPSSGSANSFLLERKN